MAVPFVVAHLTYDICANQASTPLHATKPHPPPNIHPRVMLWTCVVGQTTWLWIITTTTAATELNAMVNWMSLHKARG